MTRQQRLPVPRRAVLIGACCAAAAPFLPAHAAAPVPIVPGLLYAVGQKFDKSFNEGAFAGAERFRAASGIGVLEYLPNSSAQFDQAVGALLRRGVTDLVTIGFYYAAPLTAAAARNPDIRFTIVDAVAEGANVRSIAFREQEGAFLVGVLAALASKSGTIGIVGALDIPLIRKFIAGYEQGARHVRPDAAVLVNFVGTTPAAFNDPTTGAEVARAQFERGADVVFAAAGVSNFGIFAAARDGGRLAIGVDSNQNFLYPGSILTSMLKRVDLVVEETFNAARQGTWIPGLRELGLADRALDWALDENNRSLITPTMQARVEAARADIVAGKIRVAVS